MPSPVWITPQCHSVSDLACTSNSELLLRKDHILLLSQSPKEEAKSGFPSLIKGIKEDSRVYSSVAMWHLLSPLWPAGSTHFLKRILAQPLPCSSWHFSHWSLRLCVLLPWRSIELWPWPSHLLACSVLPRLPKSPSPQEFPNIG